MALCVNILHVYSGVALENKLFVAKIAIKLPLFVIPSLMSIVIVLILELFTTDIALDHLVTIEI